MWEISNSWQLLSFGISLLFGVGYGVYYSFFKAIRRSFRHTAFMIFWEDMFFFFSVAVVTFILMLGLCLGEIRFYILLGILIGFCAFYFILAETLSVGIAFIIKVLRGVFRVVFSVFEKIFVFLSKTTAKIAYFCKEKFEKCYNFLKKPLKEQGEIVYTKKNKQKV